MIYLFIINLILVYLLGFISVYNFLITARGVKIEFLNKFIYFLDDKILHIVLITILINIIIIILSFISIKNENIINPIKKSNKFLLIYTLLLIPFYLVLIGVGTFVTIGSFMFVPFIVIPFIFIPVLLVYSYTFVISSSLFALRLLATAYEKKRISETKYTLVSILLFFFITDVFAKFYIYNIVKSMEIVKKEV